MNSNSQTMIDQERQTIDQSIIYEQTSNSLEATAITSEDLHVHIQKTITALEIEAIISVSNAIPH